MQKYKVFRINVELCLMIRDSVFRQKEVYSDRFWIYSENEPIRLAELYMNEISEIISLEK